MNRRKPPKSPAQATPPHAVPSPLVPCYFIGGPWDRQIHPVPIDVVRRGGSWEAVEYSDTPPKKEGKYIDRLLLKYWDEVSDGRPMPEFAISWRVTYTYRRPLESGMPVYSCLDLIKDSGGLPECNRGACSPWRLVSVRPWKVEELIKVFAGEMLASGQTIKDK